MRNLLVIIICYLSATSIGSQVYSWHTEDGLSNEWISSIVQDKNGYLWIGTQYGLNRFDGYEFETINYIPNDQNSLSSNWIRSIVKDTSGIFYLNCFYGGLHRFDPNTGQMNKLNEGSSEKSSAKIWTLYTDKENNLWAGIENSMFKKTPESQNLEKLSLRGNVIGVAQLPDQSLLFNLGDRLVYLKDDQEAIYESKGLHLNHIYVDHAGQIWALSKNKLYRLALEKSKVISQEFGLDDISSGRIFNDIGIYEDHEGTLWIAGRYGINKIDKSRSKTEYITLNALGINHTNDIQILCFYEDIDQNMWIGTNKGLFMISPNQDRFNQSNRFHKAIKGVIGARSILVEGDYAWIGTEQGLFEIQKSGSQINQTKLIDHPIYSLYLTNEKVLYAGGNKKIFAKTYDSIQPLKEISKYGFEGSLIWDIVQDHQDNLWFAAVGGLNKYNAKEGSFIHFAPFSVPTLESNISQCLIIDKEGDLWGGSLTKGIYRLINTYDFSTREAAVFENYTYDTTDPNSLSHQITQSMTLDRDGHIWVGTDGGLNQIDDAGKITRYLKGREFKDDKFMSLNFDQSGNLWASTIGHGVMVFNPSTEKTIFFDKEDGLTSNNFLLNSSYLDNEGYLYLGTDGKTQIINTTDALLYPKGESRFRLKSLIVHQSGDNTEELKYDLGLSDNITLDYAQSSFDVSFSTLQYNQASETDYQYRLTPLQNEWKSNGNNRSITFNKLPSGQYRLEVKPLNSVLDTLHSTKSVNIKIKPPWWMSIWALITYLLIGSLIVWMYLKRQKERGESQKLREINDLKSKLYTDITHEIRTPLTVILGLSSSLMKNTKASVASTSEIINRNGNQLLTLTNRILDLSKIESGKVPLNLIQGDLISYIGYLLESFKSWAEDKDQGLHFLPQQDQIIMDYDAEIIKQIINNLISNAIKYCPAGSDIYCQIEIKENIAQIDIRDNGKGISKSDLNNIFDRFYQVNNRNNSTGIGLAITKELVELLNGTIIAKNNLRQGCTFSISLPIETRAPLVATSESSMLMGQASTIDPSLENLLIVEDNDDIINYVKSIFSGKYIISHADNGNTGIALAKETLPDLIISDVMMQNGTGYDLCQSIKSNELTNHIPIILLTAKVDHSSKKQGLELGADAYITKPFDPEELILTVNNLMKNRSIIKKKYSEEKSNAPTAFSDPFVQQVACLIDQNMSDTSYGINRLCRDVGISRVHLHRKLKALTDQSTSIFIRNIRLDKAYQLLTTTQLNVSEVAYDVGFSDPAYFTRVFTDRFGKAPSTVPKG